MKEANTHVVTGAFGYSGRYIAHRLQQLGLRIGTVTNSPHKANPFGSDMEVHPFNFHDEEALATSLRNTAVLYNTYWVRFNHKCFQHSSAVENTLTLIRAAKKAGVGRFVDISITNPDVNSRLEYFSGKAKLEKALKDSGIPYSILRPTVLFGPEDILVNNIAWVIRYFPVFGIFGNGQYRLQPIYVDDLAALAIEHGRRTDNVIVDAIGPETFTYRGLARAIMQAIGKRRPIVSMSPGMGYWGGWLIGKLKGDVMITRPEIEGLMSDLLFTDSEPTGSTRLTDWLHDHKDVVGRRYANELARRR